MNDDVIQSYGIDNVDEINRCIDRMYHTLTHYDAAIIVFMILKRMYRYIGKGRWEYYDAQDRLWKIDDCKRKIRSDIRILVSDCFIKRSLYWYNLSLQCTDLNDKNAKHYTSNKILTFSTKMQNDKFISVVIKEAQPFFDIHKDD
jgi:hypothetical protein